MVIKNITRRKFVKKFGLLNGILLSNPFRLRKLAILKKTSFNNSEIFIARNGTPEQNIEIIIDNIGCIESLVGKDDIVIIKTNAQSYNQGSPNLAVIKKFIEMILEIPAFRGEIIIVDNNHQNKHWNYSFEINSDIPGVFDINDMIALFHSQGNMNVTKYAWTDVDMGKNRINGPEEGDGYVYRTDLVCDNEASGSDYRATIMTYPIFTSSYSGVTIDFKNGAWQNGSYTNQPIKFILFSGLCFHSYYAGATSAIKNYLGVCDMSGGADPNDGGKLIDNYYNFHSFPFNKWSPGPVPGMLGAEVGTFLKTIRAADLNITTAEWVGWGDRHDITKAEQIKTVLVSRDPVALDYYAVKYFLFPITMKYNKRYASYIDPDDKNQPFRQYLDKCNEMGIGTLNEEYMMINLVDFTNVPVEFIIFEAIFSNGKVELSWKTGAETNNYGFEIQRSQDNIHFKTIGFIKGNGTSSQPHSYYFEDHNFHQGIQFYRLKQIDIDGSFKFSQIIRVVVTVPEKLILYQNYPNPFNAGTIISFMLPQDGKVDLQIVNIRGKWITTLLAEERNAGFHSIRWDGKDNYGRELASGRYLCLLYLNKQRKTRLLTLMK